MRGLAQILVESPDSKCRVSADPLHQISERKYKGGGEVVIPEASGVAPVKVDRPTLLSPFDSRIAFVVLSAESAAGQALHPEEGQILSRNASPKRRREFALGRIAASLALKQLGLAAPPPVLKGDGGEPIWPEGIVGSIAHCEFWVVAAAARRSVSAAIGLDLERVSVGNEEIADLVCDRAEKTWAEAGENYRERVTMVFSAKEAVFKVFYPICRRFIDFKEVRLSWISERQRFLGELLTDVAPEFRRGTQFEVGCTCDGNFVFTHLVFSCVN